MKAHYLTALLSFALTIEFAIQLADAQLAPAELVLGLRHTMNQSGDTYYAPSQIATNYEQGGDRGAASGQGYSWYRITSSGDGNYLHLPPGLVLGLRHSMNQQTAYSLRQSGLLDVGGGGRRVDPNVDRNLIRVDGFDATDPHVRSLYKDPNRLPSLAEPSLKRLYEHGLVFCVGGDRGAPAGQGFFWFETHGRQFDWSRLGKVTSQLPIGAVLALTHSQNHKRNYTYWKLNGQWRLINPAAKDPYTDRLMLSFGFARKSGGDRGASSGHGFCWYEKVR